VSLAPVEYLARPTLLREKTPDFGVFRRDGDRGVPGGVRDLRGSGWGGMNRAWSGESVAVVRGD